MSSYDGGACAGVVALGSWTSWRQLCLHDSRRRFSALRFSKLSSYSFFPSLLCFLRFETRSEQIAAQARMREAIAEPSRVTVYVVL